MNELKGWMISENGVLREPTKDELAQRKKDIAASEKDETDRQAERAVRKAKRDTVLQKLGLTAEELEELLDGR